MMEQFIVYVFIFLIEGIIVWQYLSRIFIPRKKTIIEFLLITIGYSILFIISRFENVAINIIAFLVINLIIIFSVYYVNYSHGVFQALLITILMCFTELLITGIFSLLYSDFQIYEKKFSIMVLEVVLSKFLLFLFLQIINKFFNISKEDDRKTDKSSAVLIIVPIFTIWIIIMLFGICMNLNLTKNLERMVIISSFLLVIINILVFWIFNYNQRKNKEFLLLQLNLQKESANVEYYKMLLDQNENQKILIHDIKNHFQTIAILNQSMEREKIKEYIEKIIKLPSLNSLKKYCENDLLSLMMNRYMKMCNEKNIELSININDKKISGMSENDITSLFANLLDNAIEATEKIDKGFIDFSITYNDSVNMSVVSLINSCVTPPNFDSNKKIITIKKDKKNHGFGLKSVRTIAQKYKGDIELYYDEKEQLFHTVVVLKL